MFQRCVPHWPQPVHKALLNSHISIGHYSVIFYSRRDFRKKMAAGEASAHAWRPTYRFFLEMFSLCNLDSRATMGVSADCQSLARICNSVMRPKTEPQSGRGAWTDISRHFRKCSMTLRYTFAHICAPFFFAFDLIKGNYIHDEFDGIL